MKFAVCLARVSDAMYKATEDKLDTPTELLRKIYAERLEEEIERVEEGCNQAC